MGARWRISNPGEGALVAVEGATVMMEVVAVSMVAVVMAVVTMVMVESDSTKEMHRVDGAHESRQGVNGLHCDGDAVSIHPQNVARSEWALSCPP